MKTIRLVHAALLASTLAIVPAIAQTKPDLDALMSHDGLRKTNVKGLDLVYALPGATLSAYTKIKIEPVDVAFHKNWDPTRTGSRLKLSEQERENIRTGVSKAVKDEFVRVLEQKGAYKVVNEAGPDVLKMKAQIVNLYVNAPDAGTGRSRVYTLNAGEMTLVMELCDSETGAVLARIVDRKEARDSVQMQLSNSVVSAGEAAAVAGNWARILRDALDKAHGIGKK
jgi:hypothetical protein